MFWDEAFPKTGEDIKEANLEFKRVDRAVVKSSEVIPAEILFFAGTGSAAASQIGIIIPAVIGGYHA